MINNDIPNGFSMTELGPVPEGWEVVSLGDVTRCVEHFKLAIIAADGMHLIQGQ